MPEVERVPFKAGEKEKVKDRFFKTYFAEEDARRKLKELTEQVNAIAESAEAGGNTPDDMKVLGAAARDQHKAEARLRDLTKKRKEQADAIRHNGWAAEEQLELGTKTNPDDVLDDEDDAAPGVKRRKAEDKKPEARA